MDWALYLAFVLFAFASAFTPGPNNFLLMSSGALFGFKRTLPHISGVAIGFNIVMLAAIFGMGALVARFPWSLHLVKITGALWLGWLGVKFMIAALKSKAPKSMKTQAIRARPFRFYEAILFQWVNPKGIIMAIAAASAYMEVADSLTLRLVLINGTFLLMGFASAGAWAVAGGALNRLMSGGLAARVVNLFMALLLFGTALMILLYSPTHGSIS